MNRASPTFVFPRPARWAKGEAPGVRVLDSMSRKPSYMAPLLQSGKRGRLEEEEYTAGQGVRQPRSRAETRYAQTIACSLELYKNRAGCRGLWPFLGGGSVWSGWHALSLRRACHPK